MPADRFFDAAPEVLKTLQERVAANALDLALHGTPRKSFDPTVVSARPGSRSIRKGAVWS